MALLADVAVPAAAYVPGRLASGCAEGAELRGDVSQTELRPAVHTVTCGVPSHALPAVKAPGDETVTVSKPGCAGDADFAKGARSPDPCLQSHCLHMHDLASDAFADEAAIVSARYAQAGC